MMTPQVLVYSLVVQDKIIVSHYEQRNGG